MIPENDNKKLASKGIKTTLIGILISFILAGIKIFGGIVGNSYALIADGIESIADIFISFVVLAGLTIATKPADRDHPYGYGKAEPIAGVVVSISLLIAATVIIIQSIEEIITPHHAPEPFTLIILILVIFAKEFLYRTILGVGKSIDSIVVRTDAWHHRSDAITSGAAFFGISIALIGGRGFEIADDYAALFASFIIIFNAYKLIKPAIKELMDSNVDDQFTEELKVCAERLDSVVEVEKLYVRKMGFNYYVDAHVVVDGNLTVAEGHRIAHEVKELLIKNYPKINEVLIHIEPNLER